MAEQTPRVGIHRIARVETAGPETRNTLEIEVTGPMSQAFGLLFGFAIRRALRLENAGFKTEASRQTSVA